VTTFRVIIQPSAALEMEQAFLWIAERNSEAAVRILFTIRADAVHILHVRHGARQYIDPNSEEEP
jgi:hypothetical protein